MVDAQTQTQNSPTTQTAPTNWLDEESKSIQSGFSGERLPALKLEDGKIVEITIDFSKPFESYHTTNTKGQEVTKKIIPVLHNNVKKIFWLNTKNPIYKDILEEAKKGKSVFKIIQVGTQADTKFKLIRE